MHLSVVLLLLLCLPLASGWWVGLERLTYDEARAACSPGDLAIFSSNQELSELLRTNQRLRSALASTSPAFFWVGLEKPKDQCVVPGLNQRGFRFVDGTLDSELNVWREEPPDTCTNVRCGAVALDSGSWGLVSRSCKNKKHFICGPAESGPRPESTPESRPETAGTREPDGEQTRLVPSFLPEPGLGPEESPEPGPTSGFTHEHAPDQTGPTFGPEPGLVSTSEPLPDRDPRPHPSPDPESSQVPGQTPASAAPSSGSTPSSGPGSDPSPGSGSAPSSGPGSAPSSGPSSGSSCVLPSVPGSRSLSPDDPDPGWVTVECWSGEVLLLHCDGGVWTRSGPDSEPDPSPDSGPGLNQSDARPGGHSRALRCMDCGPGFRGGEGGECEDIDECSLSPAPCAHGCVNTQGSFTCTPALLSNALVHSLIAVAAVTLSVIAAVTVWCCLRRKRRRSHKPEQDLNQNQTEA